MLRTCNLLLIALACLWLTAAPAMAGPAAGPRPWIIDAHCHLLARFGPPDMMEDDYPGAVGIALAAMDRAGVRLSVVMPPPFTPFQDHVFDAGDLAPVVCGHPDRFAFLAGGGSLNVMIQEAVAAGRTSPQLVKRFKAKAREILAQGARGFGEFAAEHFSLAPDHPYEYAPPDHPLFLLLADIAARAGVPIDLHLEAVPRDMPLPPGLASPPNPPRLKANIAALERLLAHNRGANIIWAHLGWDNTGYRTPELCARLLAAHPNLYMSLKLTRRGLPPGRPLARGGRLKPAWLALFRRFPDRFIIGSDQFHLSPQIGRRLPKGLPGVLALLDALPPELRQQIGRDNARRLFRLGD